MLTQASILATLEEALQQLDLPRSDKVVVERPADRSHGDFATNAAMVLFGEDEVKSKFKKPRDLAAKIVEQLSDSDQLATQVEFSIAGPGFINLTLKDESLVEFLSHTQTESVQPLVEQVHAGKAAIVEYSSPNIAKPFTIGHLRSTIIGDAVANLLEETGYQVFRDNHHGDWGTQFGKLVYALQHLGKGSLIANQRVLDQADRPVKELVKLYVEFHSQAEEKPELDDQARAIFHQLEQGDPEIKAIWQQCVDWSLDEFQKIYDQLGVSFTENPATITTHSVNDDPQFGLGESFFEDKMVAVIEELEAKGLLTESEGAQLVFFPDDELPPLMITKRDGSTLYATRDLATDKFRLENPRYNNVCLIINEVGGEQALYFKQIYKIEELLGWYQAGQRVHVKHGHYRFPEGKMSTRKGNVIWLEDVLAEAKDRALEVFLAREELNQGEQQALAEKVGIGALKWNDLRRASHLDVAFDWDELLNLKGNSGPYLQYTHVRTQSILAQAESSLSIPLEIVRNSKVENNTELNETQKNILRYLYEYSEVVNRAATEYAPHQLCQYLFELAQAFNEFYGLVRVVDPELRQRHPSQVMFRLQLVDLTGRVIEHGLGILGIQTVERM